MTKSLLLALSLAAVSLATVAQAQAPAGAPPPPPPRARGPATALSIEAAQAAIASCLASGYKVTALITDSAGVPVALISGDGAAERTQMIAASKVATVLKYNMPSGDVADKAKTDPALDAEIKADPKIGTARRGALPILVGGERIGVMAVSGAPRGDYDETCVKAGLEKVSSRLR